MKEINNLNVKRLNSKVGKIVLFEAAFIIAAGTLVLCANSKYDNSTAKIYLETVVVEPTVIDTVEGTNVSVPEGFVYDSGSDKGYKDVYGQLKTTEEAEQERFDDINYGAGAVGLATVISAIVLPSGNKNVLLGRKKRAETLLEEENKGKTL